MKTILFQGDSITDWFRDRENDLRLGYGYPQLVSAFLGCERPGEFRFLNRGVSGDRVGDLLRRMQKDFIDLQPDYLSILIGVNDVWRALDSNIVTTPDEFEAMYDRLLRELTQALPHTKIMLLAPFMLEGSATVSTPDRPGWFEYFRPGVTEMAARTFALGAKYGLPAVDLQKWFDAAAQRSQPSDWLEDGVHPTAQGHELIKRAWLETFAKMEQ